MLSPPGEKQHVALAWQRTWAWPRATVQRETRGRTKSRVDTDPGTNPYTPVGTDWNELDKASAGH
eukprot:5183850-Alexandrium_andersonii.AAC.1